MGSSKIGLCPFANKAARLSEKSAVKFVSTYPAEKVVCAPAPCMHRAFCLRELRYLFVYFVDCSGLLDLVFVLDSSGSITFKRFNVVKNMVIAIVNELDVRIDRTRVGLIYWSNNAFVGFNMIDYGQVKQDVVEAIRRTPYRGNWTRSEAALRLVYDTAFQPHNGDRDGVPNVAVFVSDGNSNVFPELTPVQAAVCRMNGIRMVTVGLGDMVNVAELSTIASRPHDANMFFHPTFDDLDNITAAITQTTCDGQMIISYHFCVI